jgi:hypothetical protein
LPFTEKANVKAERKAIADAKEKAAGAPKFCHRIPAKRLEGNAAIPMLVWSRPKAVPRSFEATISGTIALWRVSGIAKKMP